MVILQGGFVPLVDIFCLSQRLSMPRLPFFSFNQWVLLAMLALGVSGCNAFRKTSIEDRVWAEKKRAMSVALFKQTVETAAAQQAKLYQAEDRIRLLELQKRSLQADLDKSFAFQKTLMIGISTEKGTLPPASALELLEEEAPTTEAKAGATVAAHPSLDQFTLLGAISSPSKTKSLRWVTLGTFKTMEEAKLLRSRLISVGTDPLRLTIKSRKLD